MEKYTEEDFLKVCFNRTTINTNYRIILCIGKCQCLYCSDEVKENRPFSIFLKADDYSFDQHIFYSCRINAIFKQWMTYETALRIFTEISEKYEMPIQRYVGGGRDEQMSMFIGPDIHVAKMYLELIGKRIFKQCNEDVFQNINDASTFFEH